jgi:protein-disulfide isomerase
MISSFKRLTAIGLACAGLMVSAIAIGGGHTAIAADAAFNPAQKTEIEGIIKDYLLKNPELMIEVQRVLEQKQQVAQQEAMSKAVGANSQSLFKDAALPAAGAAKGDVTVVEFFDYNCVHCRDAVDHMGRLIDKDKNVRVVFMDFPIFGKDSEGAARVAIAAGKQGKYWELHRDLLLHKGSNSEEGAYKLAEKLGLDMTKLKADATSADVAKQLQSNRQLADKLGIQGTPHFIIDDKVIPGAPDNLFDQLASLIGDVRKTGCKYC